MPNLAQGLRASLILLALGLTASTNQHVHELCTGFLPENDMKISVEDQLAHKARLEAFVGHSLAGGLTEAQFNKVLDRIETIVGPIVKNAGGNLKIVRKWTDSTVNAYAQQFGTTWQISMFGGLARHATITEEGFALVACHESGHHLGGAPKVGGIFGGDWASNEGQSDYYATSKCLRFYYEGLDNETWYVNNQHDAIAVAGCQAQWPKRSDFLLCMRNAAAAKSVAFLFQDLSHSPVPKFDSPDPKQVTKTDDAHPQSQCRMDTYYAGARCTVDKFSALSNTDWRAGSCVQGVDAIGWRPRCWFKPN